MVIGFSFRLRGARKSVLGILGFAVLVTQAWADDQVTLLSGSTISGQIVGMNAGQVTINSSASNGSIVKQNFMLANIRSAVMTPPDAVVQVQGAAPDKVIAALEPFVKEYAGLPAPSVIDTMAQLADAYDANNQSDHAAAIYTQINQLYPNSPYQNEAVAGSAKLELQSGNIEGALTSLKPIIEKANENVAPSPSEGRLYANAFLVYGQALEAQKQFPQALEAYLTVKTMFYQNPALVAQADQLVQALREKNPGVSVD